MFESLLNKVAALWACDVIKKRLQLKLISVNNANFQEHLLNKPPPEECFSSGEPFLNYMQSQTFIQTIIKSKMIRKMIFDLLGKTLQSDQVLLFLLCLLLLFCFAFLRSCKNYPQRQC